MRPVAGAHVRQARAQPRKAIPQTLAGGADPLCSALLTIPLMSAPINQALATHAVGAAC